MAMAMAMVMIVMVMVKAMVAGIGIDIHCRGASLGVPRSKQRRRKQAAEVHDFTTNLAIGKLVHHS